MPIPASRAAATTIAAGHRRLALVTAVAIKQAHPHFPRDLKLTPPWINGADHSSGDAAPFTFTWLSPGRSNATSRPAQPRHRDWPDPSPPTILDHSWGWRVRSPVGDVGLRVVCCWAVLPGVLVGMGLVAPPVGFFDQ